MPRLCIGASSGGHMVELRALMEQATSWPLKPSVLVSTLEFAPAEDDSVRQFVIGECNRHTPWKLFTVFMRAIGVVVRTRPDVVITTGSLPLALFSLVARCTGARIVWIDSISQVDDLSWSGKLIKPFASRFFVQWPDLAKRFDGTIYVGELV